MCGRFIFNVDPDELRRAFKLDRVDVPVKPSYNIAPTQMVATIVARDGRPVLEMMRWGLIPVWAKEMSIGAKMINARAEGIADKPSFKRPLKKQRCLIVASGFYEWKQSGKKVPMFIRMKSKEPMAFAGLYDNWKSPTGDAVTSCAIITTAANELMQAFHHRMPVILPKRVHKYWLDGATSGGDAHDDLDELVALLQPYPADKMEAYPVSPLVNSIKNNSPECILPVPA